MEELGYNVRPGEGSGSRVRVRGWDAARSNTCIPIRIKQEDPVAVYTRGMALIIRSGAFEVGGYSLTIQCYPAGYSKEEEGYLSLFLDLLSTAVEKVTVKYSFEINGPITNHGGTRSLPR